MKKGQLEIRLRTDDLIVDGFAGGGGASLGIEWALGRSPDIAINHDPEAVHMHAENHPSTRHFCANIKKVDPVEATAGRRVALAWFSPDCKHHSKAKGGKPRDKNIRDLAWVVVHWAKAVRPRVIMVENVEEFASWGPLDAENRVIKARRGETFREWWASLEAEGYHIEMRILRACDYGAPTIRKRLFIIARCDGEPIVWPEPTHGPGLEPYRTAAECMKWEIATRSIFGRKKPLAENTMRRIARGVWRFVIDEAEPFIASLIHAGDARVAMVSPTLIQTGYGERPGQAPWVPGLHKPLGTVVAGGVKHALVAAYLAKHNGGHEATGSPLPDPMHTITARDQHALVTSHVLKLYGSCKDGRPITEPLGTITAGGWKFGEVRAFLTKYYGTRDHFGLVTVSGEDYAIADIGMRMLVPRELYRAQGFPDSYRIDFSIGPKPLTKTAQIKMVGNSVCPPVAAALVRANLAQERCPRCHRRKGTHPDRCALCKPQVGAR